MKVTVLIDNIGNERLPRRTGTPPLYSEWGLSFYIEYGERKVLLDAGGSGHFADNADELGTSLAEVDAAVLSHAHYDHADGRHFLSGTGRRNYTSGKRAGKTAAGSATATRPGNG